MDGIAFVVRPRQVFGAVLQSIALAVADHDDLNTSYVTRAIGAVMVAMLLGVGTFLGAAGPFRIFTLLVLVVRGDLVVLILTRLIRALIWARRLSARDLLYVNEVFPLQAAAMIWNDCRPVVPAIASEDERSVLTDLILTQRDLWRPTWMDGVAARMLKLPLYVPLQALSLAVCALEHVLFVLWSVGLHWGGRNRVPVLIDGGYPEVQGHTMLLSDNHLSWIQRFTAGDDNVAQNVEARRVAIQAIHVASLLAHAGHTRLLEGAVGGHSASEYGDVVTYNELVRALMGKADELMIFTKLPNGGETTRGSPVPRQVVWARIVGGALAGVRGHGRWRGPMAVALFQLAQRNIAVLGLSVFRTALQRHVYTAMRRWLVDWMMFIWWDMEVSNKSVEDPIAMFAQLVELLVANVVRHTVSLPHAVGELAVSTERAVDVEVMLALVLGDGWQEWMRDSVVADGLPLGEAMTATAEWQCAGRALGEDVHVDAAYCGRCPLEHALQAGPGDGLGKQARAVIAGRIVDTLAVRLRDTWERLPNRLSDRGPQ